MVTMVAGQGRWLQSVCFPELIAEYELVLSKLGKGPFTEAEENVRKEVCRNLQELYALNGNEEKAKTYSEFC